MSYIHTETHRGHAIISYLSSDVYLKMRTGIRAIVANYLYDKDKKLKTVAEVLKRIKCFRALFEKILGML